MKEGGKEGGLALEEKGGTAQSKLGKEKKNNVLSIRCKTKNR